MQQASATYLPQPDMPASAHPAYVPAKQTLIARISAWPFSVVDSRMEASAHGSSGSHAMGAMGDADGFVT